MAKGSILWTDRRPDRTGKECKTGWKSAKRGGITEIIRVTEWQTMQEGQLRAGIYRELLEEEGVIFKENGYVDMRKCK